ncbi:MAG: hypothetical protein [Inoviridae sp.]|nr:MAG: hypothetical protein [Inoviridae sp.]
MQKNLKKIKRDNALNIFVFVAMVLVFCASLVLAICAPFFNTNGVASAYDSTLPEDGIPNPNFIKNSDFSLNTKGSSTYASSGDVWTRVYDNWQILNADVSYVGNSLNVNFDTSTDSVYKRFCSTNAYFYTLEPNKTYTLTLCYYVHDLSGSVHLRINNDYSSLYNSVYLKSGNPSVRLSTSSGLHISSCTFTLARSLPEGRVEVIAQSNSTSFCNIDLYYFKLEEGSSFTGYVPDYNTQIQDLKNQLNQSNQDKKDLQSQYDNLLNSMDFSTFNNVNLTSTVPLFSSVSSSSANASYNGVSYGGYRYFRNSVETEPNSLYLCELNVGSTLLANSDIKISFDSIFPYNGIYADNVGVVLGFSNYGALSTDSNLRGRLVFIPSSDFVGKEFIYSFPFDVNYISFGIGTYDSSSGTFSNITLGYNINSSVKQGLFISNFVVKGRGSNFKTAIDNANKQGFENGFREGKAVGEDIGFSNGVKSQGDYTFMGLLGAVFDAPIQAFKGLLSFEILGVDMSAFVSSLFALAVIVCIIKIALGGK